MVVGRACSKLNLVEGLFIVRRRVDYRVWGVILVDKGVWDRSMSAGISIIGEMVSNVSKETMPCSRLERWAEVRDVNFEVSFLARV
jgi:hypothetical protein